MQRVLLLLCAVCLLLAACGGTPVPEEQRTVTLTGASGGAEIPLINDPDALLPEDVAQIPSGTECTVLDTWSYTSGHGGRTEWFYKVDCDGAVGWAGEVYVPLAPGQERP